MSEFRPSWLCYGTAALGMSYGTVAPTTAPSRDTAYFLLDQAWANGYRAIDTARSYGTAEARIGEWLEGTGFKPEITTKIPAMPPGESADFIERSLESSLLNLRRRAIALCLLHRSIDLERPGVVERLRSLTKSASIRGFGVSIYDASEFERALMVDEVSAIQAPISLLDRRLIECGLLARARARGILVFARSVFLQGALFLSPERFPPYLDALRPALHRLRLLASSTNFSLATLTFASLRANGQVDSVVVGATTGDEIVANAQDAARHVPDDVIEAAIAAARIDDPRCLDPRQWPRSV